MSAKRILMIEPRFNSYYGAQKSMTHLVKSLDSDTFKTYIVTTRNGELNKFLTEEGIDVKIVPLGKSANAFGGRVLSYSIFRKLLVVFQILFFNLRLVFLIKRNNIDIVYANDARAVMYGGIAAKLLRKPLVYYIRADVGNSQVTKLGFALSSRIITIAKGVLDGASESIKNKYKDKIVNIYTGFTFSDHSNQYEDILPSEETDPKILIGYIGSINERKGIDLLVDAMKSSAVKPKIELIFAGGVSPGHEQYWLRLKKEMTENEISYQELGYTDRVQDVMKTIDIKVLPSRSEGLPRSLIEAMYHECAVIATDVGGVQEIIPNDDFGVVISPESTEQLTKAIEGLTSDKTKRDHLAKKGKAYVIDTFRQEKYEREINHLFMNL
ncbi:glycosyltransferase [Salicibibacter kimchii]|uniref:Glycosyltransferase family 1 protein n=1 Tax=Salicibibacter kimchii TaxID=2099786 RepID=A0A345BWH8_9BACI|nr:glycosyltransferase [Salicibibacter kimchii]AXF55309.1 glycosyltransferase family 1 protein [Salicibibacter kimchii]